MLKKNEDSRVWSAKKAAVMEKDEGAARFRNAQINHHNARTDKRNEAAELMRASITCCSAHKGADGGRECFIIA